MNDFSFIDISVNANVLGAERYSRRDVMSLFGLLHSNDKQLQHARTLQAQSLAVEAADLALQSREQGYIGQNTALVFRLDASINWSAGASFRQEIRDQLVNYGSERNPSNPHILLYSQDYTHFSEVLYDPNMQIADNSSTNLISEMKKSEMMRFISNSKVLYEHGQTAYFYTPSATFHDYFIRIGNTQSLPSFSQASFFWSLPHLEGVTQFFAENWSISTTAATFAKMQNAYRGCDVSEWTFAHSYFPFSPDDRALLAEELRKCAAKGGKFLLLNSFNSTGRLAENFRELNIASDAEFSLMLSLFADCSTTIPDHEYLFDISGFIEKRGLSGEATLPIPTGVPIFGVDTSTYFPDYRRINVSKFRFGELSFDKSFFERYGGKSILSVNRRGRNTTSLHRSSTPGSMRHHAFHIDAIEIFADAVFREKLNQVWKTRPAPTVLITNGTDASVALANACIDTSRAEGVSLLTCSDPAFRELPDTEGLAEVTSDGKQRVLICVPLVITGDTLSNVQIKLRELTKRLGPVSCNISIVVGVLRPESSNKLNQLKDMYLRNPDNPEASWVDPIVVESVLLPNWQEDRCPWQRERVFLRDLLRDDLIPEEEFFRFSQRAEILASSVVGGMIGPDVFHTEGSSQLRFNPKSLWLDDDKTEGEVDFLGGKSTASGSSEADLCCAVAAALQCWREEAARKDWRFNVIDASTITNLNGFNEARLRAAIWRALTAEELKNTSRVEEGNDLRELLEKIFRGPMADENYHPLKMEARIAFKQEIERSIGDID